MWWKVTARRSHLLSIVTGPAQRVGGVQDEFLVVFLADAALESLPAGRHHDRGGELRSDLFRRFKNRLQQLTRASLLRQCRSDRALLRHRRRKPMALDAPKLFEHPRLPSHAIARDPTG